MNQKLDNISYLERTESTFIKGFLILLIVLGHNNLLMVETDGPWIKDWFYSFHVQSFLYLPFLYGKKSLTKNFAHKNFTRLAYPYIFFFVLLTLSHSFITRSFNLNITLLAFITGAQPFLASSTGMMYLWFLPAMFTMLLLKGIYDNYKWGKVILFLGIIILALNICYISNSYDSVWFPCGLFYALLNFPMALLLNFLIRNSNIKHLFVFSFLLTIISTFFWFYEHPQKYLFSFIRYIILPIGVFPVIFCLSKILKKRTNFYAFISYFGSISMGIYLISQIVFQIILMVGNHIFSISSSNQVICGIVIYLLTVSISCFILKIAEIYFSSFYNKILK